MISAQQTDLHTGKTGGYREDIDGLRAIAVVAVIIFHLGYFPNGYLGVDVFFVISGYLITAIIYKETQEDRFSLKQFYLRRTRRIIPLILFVNIVALIISPFLMLPDELENLAQSVVATNFFSNNILQAITTKDYWNVINELKPLMHTWSLGIEEQFYILYPFIFILFAKQKIRWILPVLVMLTCISLLLFFLPVAAYHKFYLIPFRFFELAIGGIGAIALTNQKGAISNKYKGLVLIGLIGIFFLGPNVTTSIKIIATVIFTLGLLISASSSKSITKLVLENKLVVGIGKISFSLYMWHQVVFALMRYSYKEAYTLHASIAALIGIAILSTLSYYFIEQPFRDKKRVSTKVLLWATGLAFVCTTGVAYYIYSRVGIVRDVPELEISKSDIRRDIQSVYSRRVFQFNYKFSTGRKIKILIIGDSFARDWINVLLESKYRDLIEISYTDDIGKCTDINDRLEAADCVYFSRIRRHDFDTLIPKYRIDTSKVRIVGTKNYGINIGMFYNKRHSANYCLQRTHMQEGFGELNDTLKKEWGSKYIDLIGMVIDSNRTVPVFTPDCKFITHDCLHFTHAGAVYYAALLSKNNFNVAE